MRPLKTPAGILALLPLCLLLTGCKFAPDIAPIEWSGRTPPVQATRAQLQATPAVIEWHQEGSVKRSLPFALAGGALALGAGAGAVALRHGDFSFRPRIRRILWILPLAGSLAAFGLAADRCSGAKICYANTPGMLVAVPCEEEERGLLQATETKTALPPPLPGEGSSTPDFGEISGDWPTNSVGEPYPRYADPRTGEPIPPPQDDLTIVPEDQRVPWDRSIDRAKFIAEWHERGYPEPEGGWDKYDIHHITPRRYGGTNEFDNLVPVERGFHQQQFNRWWVNYP